MDYDFYVQKLEQAASRLNPKQLEVRVGIVLDSVFLKLYKKEWTSDREDPLNAASRIFFSIWINEKTIQAQKVCYNIHAFKLRHLKGYSIASRDFAHYFREAFREYQSNWENVSTRFGPLTLMEGWKTFDDEHLESTVEELARNFLEIDHLVDEALDHFKTR